MSDYVATKPLRIGLVRARKVGDVVTAEEVERFGWHDGVEKVGSERAAKPAKAAPRKKATPRK